MAPAICWNPGGQGGSVCHDARRPVPGNPPRDEIAMIKVAAPSMALRIIDNAMQAHGGGGVSDDFGLAHAYAMIRTLRFADGPDEVHNRAIARMESKRYTNHDHRA